MGSGLPSCCVILVECRVLGRWLRVFRKPWDWPYYFHRWGFRGFGAGPFGFMLFDTAPRGREDRNDGTR